MAQEQPRPGDPITHAVWREWTEEALGDRRQIYARDVAAPPGSPLVYMPDRQAPDFRADAQNGRLVCPVPGCPSPMLTTRGPAQRRHHFVHRQSPGGTDHDRAYRRQVATKLLAEWAQSLSARLEVSVKDELSDVAVTVHVRSPKSGRRVALIYVDARLGADAWRDQDEAVMRGGATPAWVFALRPMYFRPPEPAPGAPPDSPLHRDRQRGDLVLDRPLYRAMREHGRWPLLLSTDRRELANLFKPDSRVAARLHLRPPTSAERVLHLVAHGLADCGLCEHGIVTPAVSRAALQPGAQRADTRAALTALAHAGPAPRSSRAPRSSSSSTTAQPAVDLTKVLHQLPATGAAITYEALRRKCGVNDHRGDRALREALYRLRAEGHVAFHGALVDRAPIIVAG